MDRLGPLLDLRAAWTAAAMTTMPRAGADIVDALDHVLDRLVRRGHLSEADLLRGVDWVMGHVAGRADRRDLLDRRLRSAVRDYVAQTTATRDEIEADAFDDLASLADALMAMRPADAPE
jgi:hypothetical protein